MLLCEALPPKTMNVDLLIKNGRIFDPKMKLDTPGAILVKNKKIAKIIPGTDFNFQDVHAKEVINAKGCLVTPGLIDVHTHCNYRGQANGMPVDIAGIPSSVTATADAGSTGVSNYRGLLDYLSTCETKTKIMLNVSACGIIMPTQFSEPVDPALWDVGLFDEAFAECGEKLIGLKIRVSRNIVGELGLTPLKKAVELAERYQTRVIVHPTDPPTTMEEILSILRTGDVLTHVYHGEGSSILDGENVLDAIWEARARGVLFDCANGKANTKLAVVRQALKNNFLPDTISTDLTLTSWKNPWIFNLPVVMSKYMALGLTLEEVILRTTANAAEQLGMAGDWGTLKEGSSADISILELENRVSRYPDRYGDFVEGIQMLVPRGTIIDGNALYVSTELF